MAEWIAGRTEMNGQPDHIITPKPVTWIEAHQTLLDFIDAEEDEAANAMNADLSAELMSVWFSLKAAPAFEEFGARTAPESVRPVPASWFIRRA
jgi:hypothetical protein